MSLRGHIVMDGTSRTRPLGAFNSSRTRPLHPFVGPPAPVRHGSCGHPIGSDKADGDRCDACEALPQFAGLPTPKAASRVTAPERDLILRLDRDGYTDADIARLSGRPTGTVKKTLRRERLATND